MHVGIIPFMIGLIYKSKWYKYNNVLLPVIINAESPFFDCGW